MAESERANLSASRIWGRS